MLSKWIYVLIGDDQTGKTIFQKRLIYYLCGLEYERLDRNFVFNVTHPRAPKKLRTLFTINRSYQETVEDYGNVEGYFVNHFKDANICILSSHSHPPCIDNVKEMIEHGHRRKYNVGGIFWSNCNNPDTAEISLLNWDERFWIDNPVTEERERWPRQIDELARQFADMLVVRAYLQ